MLVGRCPSPLDADGDDMLLLQNQKGKKIGGSCWWEDARLTPRRGIGDDIIFLLNQKQ